ncbi:WhiB family transcriptional regulator [Streptomyces sp. Tue6028]|uniref:WhiB family transcriptional regulator n=1 Tax=Streptomyces sp. Tue6028 TaxID=2036037 RepID=UPI003EBEC5A6
MSATSAMSAHGDSARAPAARRLPVRERAAVPGAGGQRKKSAAPRPDEGHGVPDWELRAACRDEDPELWFSGRTRETATAMCNACQVLPECRTAVLRREAGLSRCDRAGIVAGLTGSQRYELEKRRARQPAPAATRPVEAGRSRGEPAPCGTRAAYQRHVRRGEPADEACRAANARDARLYRRTGSTVRSTDGPARDGHGGPAASPAVPGTAPAAVRASFPMPPPVPSPASASA